MPNPLPAVCFFISKNAKNNVIFQFAFSAFRKSKVLKPEEVKNHKDPILIASSFWYHDIYELLVSYGIDKSRIYSSSLI